MPERWKVINVQERLTVLPEGGIGTMFQVRFQLPTGFIGSVELPREKATKETIRVAIDAEATRIEEIYSLRG